MNRFTSSKSLKSLAGAAKPSLDNSYPAGATLTEILMALMVMGIGLVSVASLFPISMLRSAQATKLTNAVLLKLQCEEYIQALPGLARNNYNSSYPDQTKLFLGNSKYLGNVEFTPRSVVWPRHSIKNPNILDNLKNSLPLNVVSVVDPLGAWFNVKDDPLQDLDADGIPDALLFGKDPYKLHTVTALYYTADRKNGGFNLASTFQKNQAFSMFGSNDSWKQFLSSIEVTGGGAGATTVTLNDADAADVAEFGNALTAGSLGRIVLVDITGKQSHVSLVTGVSGKTITFSAPLPENGLYGAISEVRLELFESRYTCMVTLRKQLVSLGASGTPGDHLVDDDQDGVVDNLTEVGWPTASSSQEKDVVRILGGDLVVFFRRDFSAIGEQVYGVENLVKGQVGIQPQEVRIRWRGDKPDSKPRIRQGGYVFDSRNGYWYQIRTVIEEDRAVPAARLGATPWIDSSNDREAVIMLDRSPEATGQFLMVPENVVEVFEFTAF